MQTIELEGHEHITVLRDLLERATDREVLIFVPRGCEALEKNRVNLTVLRRWGDSFALYLGLVIEDRETRGLARNAGFVVLPSIRAGQKASLTLLNRRRRRRRGLPPRPRPLLLLTEAVGQTTRKRSWRWRVKRYASLLLAAAAFSMLALALVLALPSATVTLAPVSEPVHSSMEMVGVLGLSDINYGTGQVPARTVSIERDETDTIATTNKRHVPDAYAQGTIIIANKTSIPVTITKGTVVHTAFGQNVRFYIVADVWLPGELHHTVRVGIIAAEPGPSGNVPALTVSQVEGELAAHVDILNDTRTSGGTVRPISTVDGEDKVQLRAKLMKRLQEEAYSELTSALAEDEFIPPESLVLAVLDEEFDYKIGDITDKLGMRMRVEANGLAISGADGGQLLVRLLEQGMKPGYRLLDDSVSFERDRLIEATPEQARFTMSARAAIAPAIDVDQVRRAIAGKTVEAAKELLSERFKLESEPQVELQGSVLGRLPWWTIRTQVRVTTG